MVGIGFQNNFNAGIDYINWLTQNKNFDYMIVAQKLAIIVVVGCMPGLG